MVQTLPSIERRLRPGRIAAIAGLLAVMALVGAALAPTRSGSTVAVPAQVSAGTSATEPQYTESGDVIVPNVATNGVLAITIPAGTGETMAAGRHGYVLPAVIKLQVGDRIVIRNRDVFPHFMLFAIVMPGETVERSMTEPMSETYSAGCTADPTQNGFTSLFVSPYFE